MQAQQCRQGIKRRKSWRSILFKQLIEINATDSVSSVTAAAEVMAQRFRDDRFPESDIQVIGPNDRKKTWWSASTGPANISGFC